MVPDIKPLNHIQYQKIAESRFFYLGTSINDVPILGG